jgi:hypothetical protein
MDHFKQHFRETLELATAVYPDADVSLDGATGIILRPSRPPIPTRIAPSRGALRRLLA